MNNFFSKSQIKKYWKFTNLLLFVAVECTSCRYSKEPKTFTDKNVSIQYPSWLFVTDDVYPEKNTLLQLKNDYRDVYFILIDHGMKPGNFGFDIMVDSISGQLKHNMREVNIESRDTSFTTANNLKVKEMQMSGVMSSKQQDLRFIFIVDVFETKDGHLYETAGWMLRNKRNKWVKDIQRAAYSLKIN